MKQILAPKLDYIAGTDVREFRNQVKIYNTNQYVLILALTIWWWFADSAFAARPAYYGLAPAYPKSEELPLYDSTFPFIMKEQSILLQLEIDQTGLFKKALPDSSTDTVISKYVLSSLRKVSFEPATKSGKPVLSVLPVRATVQPRFRNTVVEWPVNVNFEITNRHLYFLALKLLGTELPKIKKFPPYFCNLKLTDSLKHLPFALLSVNLNETGEFNSSEIVETNLPAYVRQIQSAALWAEFSPLMLDNKAVPSAGFLLVSFFPQLQYPTTHLEIKGDSIYPWYERWRVQFLPDTAGLMMPAMPTHQEVGNLTIKGKNRRLYGEFIANLLVDTLGNVRTGSIDINNPPLQQALNLALKDVKFFPATAYNGELKSFQGKATVSFDGTSNIQIEYLWLND